VLELAEGDLRRFLRESGRQGAGEPLLEEPDTAQAPLITEFPMLKCCTKKAFDPLRAASNQAAKASCAR
jgi:hypothetical protein